MKKEFYLLMTIVLFLTSCNIPSEQIREIKFKKNMQLVANKYKDELQPDIFETKPGLIKLDTSIISIVIITIYNAKKLPDSKINLNTLARNIASDTYPQIENRNDYSRIEIIFQSNKGNSLLNYKMNRNFIFKYEQLLK